MATSFESTVLGVVVLARHGDRQGFYQDPETYTASSTVITPLGEQQEFQLGSLLRSIYLNASAATYIQGIANSSSLFQPNQVVVRADAGGEGGVIVDSAIALTQGLWPATPKASTQLADGTNVTSPLGGYQYVPIESVEPNEDVSLEGFTSCNTFDDHTEEFYQSSAFKDKASQAAQFLTDLKPYMDGRPVTLENMWNIFDYINVQSIHNATFAKTLPAGYLAQARDLANWHEYNVFSDDSSTGIGNIAFRTMIPSVLNAVQRIANASDPLKLHYSAIAYKPFLSLFNMTGVAADGGLPPTIVNYAASVVLEVRQPADGSEPVVRFNFKNGTDDAAFRAYAMNIPGWYTSGGIDMPVPTFINALQPAAVNTTLGWCNVCGQTQARGCADLLHVSNRTVLLAQYDRISPVGAGFLGAGLTIAVFGAAFAVLIFLGYLTFGKGKRAASRTGPETHDHVELRSSTNSITKESA
ncbi:phosphoglycerate mutase-like protein [Pilatotrama ljubarskyi]|nr:phosphoglycerate mutase-like protein [Pilatotrama ljubarskyi]